MNRTLLQLIKYGLVGLTTNTVGYLLYLWTVHLGISPILAMTLLYILGATMGFIGNRKLTFKYTGSLLGSGSRYLLTHLAGYTLNLGILVIFVDKLGYPHQLIQAIAILTVAAFLFIMFKTVVFRSPQK